MRFEIPVEEITASHQNDVEAIQYITFDQKDVDLDEEYTMLGLRFDNNLFQSLLVSSSDLVTFANVILETFSNKSQTNAQDNTSH